MHIQDRPPGSRPPEVATDHVALQHLRRTSGRLRARLLAFSLAAPGVPLLLALIPGNRLASTVSGPYTFGMPVFGTGALALVAAALWYDRACRVHCDPLADELRDHTAGFGPGPWGRR